MRASIRRIPVPIRNALIIESAGVAGKMAPGRLIVARGRRRQRPTSSSWWLVNTRSDNGAAVPRSRAEINRRALHNARPMVETILASVQEERDVRGARPFPCTLS